MNGLTPDKDLLRKARRGSRDAFDRLAQKHRPELLSFVSSRLRAAVRARLEAEDVVQDTLLTAFRVLDRFEWRGPDSFGRWLRAIAEHSIRNASRKRFHPDEPLGLEPAGGDTSPSRALRRHERFDRLQRALLSLSPDHREVIQLARIEGLKIAEIARRMDRSPGAVKQLLSRALDQLKDRFGETESLRLPGRRLDLGEGAHG